MAQNKLIEADKFHITNVIHNLLDNSQKYSINPPIVSISTRDVIGGLIIRIKDNGIGIARKIIKEYLISYTVCPLEMFITLRDSG